MESTSGPQGGATLGNGSTARCTVKANTFGRTDANTKGGTSTTKNMGPGSTVGPMDGSLTASGSMEDERGRVNWSARSGRCEQESGKKTEEWNGSMKRTKSTILGSRSTECPSKKAKPGTKRSLIEDFIQIEFRKFYAFLYRWFTGPLKTEFEECLRFLLLKIYWFL